MPDAVSEAGPSERLFHRPVLADEVVQHLVTRPGGTYVDGTVGTGGHAEAILRVLDREGRLLGIDRDPEALDLARRRLASFGGRCLLLHGPYEDLDAAGRLLGTRQVDGLLLDLGLSSYQLHRRERGFSFGIEGPLDMRMDPTEGGTAARLLERSSVSELEKILREFGEEPQAPRIARAIVEARRRRPIRTTTELAALVAAVVPRRGGRRRLHPATRTFQALRIAVNRELERLQNFLERAPDFLRQGGRLVILSYHSLEDRLVKRRFLNGEREGLLRRITRKPIRPTRGEVQANPRARSVRMRVAERMG